MAHIRDAYDRALEALFHAARVAAECSNASRTASSDVSRLCQDVADLCWLSAMLATRGSHFLEAHLGVTMQVLEVTAAACRSRGAPHDLRCARACDDARSSCGLLIGRLPIDGNGTGQRAVPDLVQ